jgi:putative heme-binding domain-containing protein
MKSLIQVSARRAKAGLCASVLLTALFTVSARSADNPFADIIRKTGPLTPEQEQKAFHLPPGFEIQLVAADPDIGKPINMAFDSQGRLWISQSREYPFPAPDDRPARDQIKILSEFAPDGRAQKIVTFATNLNIPIGLYPYKDGVLAYSIPYIYHLRDTNHVGHEDSREKFLGTFGYQKDTHGMTSSFRRGYDGWFYANHGYHNDTTLTARDGSSIQMTSGNTYRIRMDGTQVEHFAWGRVNPFGLFFDPLGNLYSADCETLPIYQIMRGAYYPSFGRPDDGLGFAPPMMDHKHGSTAIAGIVYYAATNFPPAFRNNIFVGNVMTCRIDRDSLTFHGSSPWANEEPDFLSTDDPWFRPVDLQLGPDGALYVADFYNRIIGHYEVPLDNPGRDRERGRIWRIVYRGTNANSGVKIPEPQDINLARDSAAKLIKQLGNSNLTIRMLAMSELTDRIGPSATKPLIKMVKNKHSSNYQKISGLWVLYRLGTLDPQLLAAAAKDPDRVVRVHAMRIYSETTPLSPEQYAILDNALNDPDALVERCAADALGQHPRFEDIRPLLDARERAPAEDTHLIYVLRMELRNELAVTNTLTRLPLADWTSKDEEAVVNVLPGTPTADSAVYLLHHLEKHDEPHNLASVYLEHISRYLPPADADELISYTRDKFKNDSDLQLSLFNSIEEGQEQRGAEPSAAMREWAGDLAAHMAAANTPGDQDWHNVLIAKSKKVEDPWVLEKYRSADGQNDHVFISSQPDGEKLTGILRSKTFVIPDKLSFFVAGHDGYPNKAAQNKNLVRLRDAVTGKVLIRARAPRKDVAQPVTWDLAPFAGQKGYLEIVDGDDGAAYAWIAVGRLDPAVVALPTTDPRAISAREEQVAKLARSFRIVSLEPDLTAWLEDKATASTARGAAAQALMTIDPDKAIGPISAICKDPEEEPALREKMALALASANSAAARLALLDSFKTAPDRLQVRMALALANNKEGGEALLRMAEQGKVSPRLILNRAIKERLSAVGPDNYVARVEKITKGLPPEDVERQQLLDARRKNFDPAQAHADLGAKVFAKNCMICHSMDNRGGAVGPHLDGIGNRGLERLVEDVLDPSRNVDPSFRYSIVELKDGDVYTGLLRREEGKVLVFVDATGKETSIPTSDIVSRKISSASLMPDNFSDVIPVADFNNLMAFLLSKGSGTTTAKK